MTVIWGILRGIKWAGLGLLAFLAVYIAAAIIAALFPSQGRAHLVADGRPIHLCAGVVHTDFAIPAEHATTDTYGPLASTIPTNLHPDVYALIGWGDYRFFTKVQTIQDLRPSIALGAIFGTHDTALRIILVREGNLPAYCRPLEIDAQGRSAIAEHIANTIAAPMELLPQGKFGERFILAKNRYNAFRTCNGWAAAALRKAGLPSARFAPFSFSVSWPLD